MKFIKYALCISFTIFSNLNSCYFSKVSKQNSLDKKLIKIVKRPTLNLDEVRNILNRGANPNFQDKNTLETSLHYASRLLCISKTHNEYVNTLKTIKTLLIFGANPNLSSNIGEGPIHCAIRFNQAELAELLLLFGAKFDKSDADNLRYQGILIPDYIYPLINLYCDAAAGKEFLSFSSKAIGLLKNKSQDLIYILVNYTVDDRVQAIKCIFISRGAYKSQYLKMDIDLIIDLSFACFRTDIEYDFFLLQLIPLFKNYEEFCTKLAKELEIHGFNESLSTLNRNIFNHK